MEPTLENLVKISLQRTYSPSTFFKLFKDFTERFEKSSTDKLDRSPLYTNLESDNLQRQYVFQVLVSSDLDNTCEEITHYFSTVSTKIPAKDQLCILLLINQFSSKFPWKVYSNNTGVLTALTEYCRYLMQTYKENPAEFLRIVFLFVKAINSIFENATDVKLNELFIGSISEFCEWLKTNALTTEYHVIQTCLSQYNLSSIKFGFTSNEQIGTNAANSLLVNSKSANHRKTSWKSHKLKKIVWLSQKVTVEFAQLDNQFVVEFKNLINLSNVSTLESMPNLVIELFTGMFECLKLSTDSAKHIWKEYIVCKVPWFLKNVLKINRVKFEKAFLTTFTDEIKTCEAFNDIIVELEQNLVELSLVRPDILARSNTEKTSTDQTTLTLDELNHSYTYKFMECNPEFTSIEEAGIVDFLTQINKSIKLKHKFCELVIESINSFILTGDTLRLRRLLISCSINFEILDNLLLCQSPYTILLPLLNFLNDKVLQVPESTEMNSAQKYLNQSNQPDLLMDLDIATDDSSNVQEFLGDIGTTVLFTQLVISRYSIILQNNQLPTIPNALALLRNFKVVINKESKEGSVKEITVDDDTINKWISSMFDPSNVDGISDSLVQISSPIEYSQLIPKIVHEAVICNHIGWLDDDSLMGGLEYLHQKFLAGWMVYVISDICEMKWKTSDPKMEAVLNKVVKQLLEVESKQSLDVEIMIKLSKHVMNDMIWENFPELRHTFAKPSPKLSTHRSLSNLIRFVSMSEKNKTTNEADDKKYNSADAKMTFELTTIWSRLLPNKLAVDYLFEELKYLQSDPDTSGELCYELLAILLVVFAKWVVGEKIIISWSKALSQIDEANFDSENHFNLIFNRKPSDIVFKSFNRLEESKDEDSKLENGFFGFIQEPDFDDNVVADIKIENTENDIDIYGDNLVVIAYESRGNLVAETFLRKLMECLT